VNVEVVVFPAVVGCRDCSLKELLMMGTMVPDGARNMLSDVYVTKQ
jgi:hypothetical protein